jgi:hypothetical protein
MSRSSKLLPLCETADHPFINNKQQIAVSDMTRIINNASGLSLKGVINNHQSGRDYQRPDMPMDFIYRDKWKGVTLEVNTSFLPIDKKTADKFGLGKDITGGLMYPNLDRPEIVVSVGDDGYYKILRNQNTGSAAMIEEMKKELKIVGDAINSSNSPDELVGKLKTAKYKPF